MTPQAVDSRPVESSRPPVSCGVTAPVGAAGSLLALCAISIAATWPLVPRLNTHLAGDFMDAWQSVWGFWWVHASLAKGANPMYSELLWSPQGVPLWFQTWDLPAVLGAYPFHQSTSSVTLYNVAVLASFPLSGLSLSWLCRTLYGGWLGPCLAGCLYTFSTYHFAHARGQLHISSMYWSPMYFASLTVLLRTCQVRHAMLRSVQSTIWRSA